MKAFLWGIVLAYVFLGGCALKVGHFKVCVNGYIPSDDLVVCKNFNR